MIKTSAWQDCTGWDHLIDIPVRCSTGWYHGLSQGMFRVGEGSQKGVKKSIFQTYYFWNQLLLKRLLPNFQVIWSSEE